MTMSEEEWRSLHERQEELKSTAEDAQDNGKPVRCNSYELDPPKKQNKDSDLRRPLLSDNDTFTSEPVSTKELRFIMLGGDEYLMDHACDIILRKRAARADSEIRHRKGHVCGRKITVVKAPSTWMSHVASCCCFESRLKSIKDEMVDCASQVFPGPHAFLLVTDNRKVTGSEKYLLKAIAKVFGIEALDYAMLLIIGRTEPKGIRSVRKYVRRFYTLEDTEQSVKSLFIETERMTQYKESTFFIQSSYENLMKKAFLSWEKERSDEIQKEHAQEVIDLKERLRTTESKNENLQRELEELKLKERKWEQKLEKAEGMAKKEQEIQPTGEQYNPHSNVELNSPGLSQAQSGSLEGELKSKDEDSYASESLESGKPMRRNSNQFVPPNITGSEQGEYEKYMQTGRNNNHAFSAA
ncbi:hypothetical protein QQF64_018161 [Cirrhinus molitorella]|uniref:AIG1-type G domain-containing protein n=1 Tax=Cirrhinus molitorella TaxID=172907 RepID=A0ABR3LKQ2_9TELE